MNRLITNCPNCGKFVNPDGEAFYTREMPDDDTSPVVACCNKDCADQYASNKPLVHELSTAQYGTAESFI